MRKINALLLMFSIITLCMAIPIEMDYHVKSKKNKKSPVIIIAPGNGYHKDLPLIKGLAEKAEKNHWSSVRFNWRFFTENGKASQGYKQEIQDILDIIDQVKHDPQADSTKIFLVGKSLGSVLAYNASLKSSGLAGIVLLTPILPDTSGGAKFYPRLNADRPPTLFVVGDKDSDNCDLKALYQFCSDSSNQCSINITRGDHGMNIEPYVEGKKSEINQENVDLITDQIFFWIKTRFQ